MIMIKKILHISLLMLLSGIIYSQDLVLNGLIIDENNQEPLIGVTVLIDNSETGTVTDLDGTFALNVKPNDKLTISYVGYQSKTVDVAGQTELTISLVALLTP